MRISATTWETDGERLSAVRTEVFVDGQGVDPAIESDGLDPDCFHALASDDGGRPVGAARMSRKGKIGRMAVLEEHRGRGIGGELLRRLLEVAEAEGISRCYLHSQSHAAPFYERFGFVAEGDGFEEAGIPHVMMVRRGGIGP